MCHEVYGVVQPSELFLRRLHVLVIFDILNFLVDFLLLLHYDGGLPQTIQILFPFALFLNIRLDLLPQPKDLLLDIVIIVLEELDVFLDPAADEDVFLVIFDCVLLLPPSISPAFLFVLLHFHLQQLPALINFLLLL